MSIELVLIPVGIAAVHSLSAFLDREKGNVKIAKTVMKREDLLQKAVEQYGCDVKQLNEENFETEIGNVKIFFQKDENGVIEAVFDKNLNAEDVTEFIHNIETEYKYLIQQDTYEKLLEKAKDHGLVLELEERQEDRSILLTFNVTNKNL